MNLTKKQEFEFHCMGILNDRIHRAGGAFVSDEFPNEVLNLTWNGKKWRANWSELTKVEYYEVENQETISS